MSNFQLQAHIALDKGMWMIPILSASPYNLGLLCTMYAAVHSLINGELETRTQLTHYLTIKEGKFDPNS